MVMGRRAIASSHACYACYACYAAAGEEALAAFSSGACDPVYPIRHGLVDNWDHMEKFWQYCISQ